MNVFLDSDVLLDVLLNRKAFVDDSIRILDWAEQHPGASAVSWHALANIHYLSKNGAQDFIEDLLTFCVIPPAGTPQMLQALQLQFADLEDAMQVSCAMLFQADVLCTRNVRDYAKSPLRVLSPQELVTYLS